MFFEACTGSHQVPHVGMQQGAVEVQVFADFVLQAAL